MNVRKGLLTVTTASAVAILSGCQGLEDPFEYQAQPRQAQVPAQQLAERPPNEPAQQQAQQQAPPPAPSSLVREVQQALNEQGYDIVVDGIWGPNTHQALTQFQQQQGIQGDGQLSLATIRELDMARGQQTAQAAQQQTAPPDQE